MQQNSVSFYTSIIFSLLLYSIPLFAQLNFTRHTIDSNLSSAYWVYSKDIDRDGDMDLVTASQSGVHWWKNNGGGSFSKRFVGSLNGAWTAYADDIDQDGRIDILGGSPTTDEVLYWRNNGGQSFTKIIADNTAQDPETVVAADMDGDGDDDILASAWIDGQIVLFENTGGGNFSKHVIDSNISGAHSVAVGDLDGDGDNDIAASSSGKTRWYRNNGNLNFSQQYLASNGGWSVFIVDIDRDGDNDVLRSQRNNGDIDLLQNSGGSFSERNIESGYGECWSVTAGDLDGDGDIDVAAAGFDANNIKVWLNDGHQNFGTGQIVDQVNRPRSVFIADFDKDGDGDIAAAIRDDKDLNWYESTGTPPQVNSITVRSPNGGETLFTGNNYSIQWNSSGSISSVKIEFSTDGGSHWTTLISSTSNDGSYGWTVPDAPSSNSLIRISDASNGSVSDVSNGVFTIKSAAVTVRSPNGGETLFTGNNYSIQWTSSGSISSVKIEFSTDGGSHWTTLISSTSNDGSYSWLVPGTPSSNSLIRISDASNASVSDVSNGAFTIKNGDVTVRSPNGGETLFTGNNYSIQWNSSGSISSVKIEFSTDGGSHWTTLISSTSNDGSYSWLVPGTPSSNSLIRISDASNASVSDVSNNAFTIKIGILTLASPNGGELFLFNSSQSITWSSIGNTSFVDILFSIDGGTNWNTIAAGVSNNGQYNWSVPETPSTNCLIRIIDSEHPTVIDESDNVFAITSGVLTITAPNGGERLLNGSGFVITWDTLGDIPFVNLDYSVDGGQTWNPVVTTYPNSGSFKWIVPFQLSNDVLIRISDSNDGALTDISDNLFSIVSQILDMEITINGDDEYTLYVNGDSVGSNNQWNLAQTFTVPVVDGLNVLAVQGVNPHNQGGLITEVKINGTVTLITDSNWRYSSTQDNGWFDINFDDSHWQPATDYGHYGVAPWFNGIQGIPTNTTARWIWQPDALGNGGFFRAGFQISNAIPAPEIVSFTPALAPVGSEIKIFGNNFNGASQVSFNGVNSDIFSVLSDTVISAMVPSSATSGKITIITPGGISESATDFIVGEPKALTLLEPDGGQKFAADSLFTIVWSFKGAVSFVKLEYSLNSGKDWLSLTQGADNTGSFNWTVPDTSSDSCLVRVSDVSDSTVFDISDSLFSIFQISPPLLPVLSSFTPATGMAGTKVTISGKNFVDVVDVAFGDSSASFSVVSSVEIQATVPENAKSGHISVTTVTGKSVSAESFIVTHIPEISFFTPERGQVGEEVVITGRYFTGVSEVHFNQRPAEFRIASDTQIVTFVPDSAVTGKITLVSPTGTIESHDIFTVKNEIKIATSSFIPTDDAQIAFSSPAMNFGHSDSLKVQNGKYQSYLKFHIFGINGDIQKATLRLFVKSASFEGGDLYLVSNEFKSSDKKWDEYRLTFQNAPEIGTLRLGSRTVGNVAGFVHFDVTSAVDSNGIYSFVITSESSEGITYNSKEAGEFAPELIIEFAGQPEGLPEITDFNPATAVRGSEVSLAGLYFASTKEVIFGGTPTNNFTVVSDKELRAVIPKESHSGKIGVRDSMGVGLSDSVLYLNPKIILDSFAPDSGRAGKEIVLNGLGFADVEKIYFNQVAAEFILVSNTEIKAVVPDSVTSGFIVLTSPTEESISLTPFVVISDSGVLVDDIPILHGGNGGGVPEKIQLVGSYPNPFNLETTIEYALPEDMSVTLKIYNLLGQQVRVIVDEFQRAGFKSVRWDGTDDFGNIVSSGIYFVRMVAGDKTFIKKISLQK